MIAFVFYVIGLFVGYLIGRWEARRLPPRDARGRFTKKG